MPKVRLELRERGDPCVMTKDDWSAICEDEAAIGLVAIGAIRIKPSGNFVSIEPGTLIGAFDSPRLSIVIRAKSPELGEELIRRLAMWRKEVSPPDVDVAGKSNTSNDLWSSFRSLLVSLLSEGVPWAYVRKSQISSTPKGRVDFRGTIGKLAARGIFHKVVHTYQARQEFAWLAPALDAVRRQLHLIGAAPTDQGFKVSRLIEGVGDRSNSVDARSARILFREVDADATRPAFAKIVDFSRAILGEDEPFRVSTRIGRGVAEFIDMEKLWEHATHMFFSQKRLPGSVTVELHPLRSQRMTLFSDGGPVLDPDIVAFTKNKPLAVIDAKYSITSVPSASDVYQLTCYVERLAADIGILAYVAPNAGSAIKLIGTTSNGAKLFICSLSVDAFLGNGPEFVGVFV